MPYVRVQKTRFGERLEVQEMQNDAIKRQICSINIIKTAITFNVTHQTQIQKVYMPNLGKL